MRYIDIMNFMSVEHKNWTTLVFAHQWWLHLCSKQPSTRFMRLFYNLQMFDCFWASFLQYFWLFLKRIPLTVDCYERNRRVRDFRPHRFSSPLKKNWYSPKWVQTIYFIFDKTSNLDPHFCSAIYVMIFIFCGEKPRILWPALHCSTAFYVVWRVNLNSF